MRKDFIRVISVIRRLFISLQELQKGGVVSRCRRLRRVRRVQVVFRRHLAEELPRPGEFAVAMAIAIRQ